MSDATAGCEISKCWLGRQAETVDALIRMFQICRFRAYLEGCRGLFFDLGQPQKRAHGSE